VAVYTEVGDTELEAFLAEYDIGRAESFKGIAEGVENSNFLLTTTKGQYILTLYEKRVDPPDLPFFLGLMDHLAARGITCPQPIHGRDGNALRTLAGKPAAIVTSSCRACGRAARRSRIARRSAKRWPACTSPARTSRSSAPTPCPWPAGARCGRAARRAEIDAPLDRELGAEIAFFEANWPGDLPAGVIHADLFPTTSSSCRTGSRA
jgi:homoserine kinase type II